MSHRSELPGPGIRRLLDDHQHVPAVSRALRILDDQTHARAVGLAVVDLPDRPEPLPEVVRPGYRGLAPGQLTPAQAGRARRRA